MSAVTIFFNREALSCKLVFILRRFEGKLAVELLAAVVHEPLIQEVHAVFASARVSHRGERSGAGKAVRCWTDQERTAQREAWGSLARQTFSCVSRSESANLLHHQEQREAEERR